jgi:hypothetical protein
VLKNRRVSVRDIDYTRDFQTNVETITAVVTIPPGVDDAALRNIADDMPELTRLAVR